MEEGDATGCCAAKLRSVVGEERERGRERERRGEKGRASEGAKERDDGGCRRSGRSRKGGQARKLAVFPSFPFGPTSRTCAAQSRAQSGAGEALTLSSRVLALLQGTGSKNEQRHASGCQWMPADAMFPVLSPLRNYGFLIRGASQHTVLARAVSTRRSTEYYVRRTMYIVHST